MSESIENQDAKPEKPIFLKDIDPIEQSSSSVVRSREDLKNLVELPLLNACEILWDNNIRTIASSANKKDLLDGNARIVIDFNSLSKENKKIAMNIGDPYDYADTRALNIDIPVHEGTQVENIENAARIIVSGFKSQPMIWAEKYSLDDIREQLLLKEMTIEEAKQATGLYYDDESGYFYRSEEQFKKSSDQV